MFHLYCEYRDCLAAMLVRDEDVPKQHGAYAYDCPVCRRGVRFGVVNKFHPVSPPGGLRGGRVVSDEEETD